MLGSIATKLRIRSRETVLRQLSPNIADQIRLGVKRKDKYCENEVCSMGERPFLKSHVHDLIMNELLVSCK